MLAPGTRIHFGGINTDDHEQLLYNTLRFQLEYIIQNYMSHTRRSDPILFVFDMSNMRAHI